MKIVYILLLVLLFSAGAAAQSYDSTTLTPEEEKLLEPWNSFTALLRSKGIEPATVNWNEINPSCLGVKQQLGETAYNRCRFQRLVYFDAHRKDLYGCNLKAKKLYPSFLLTKGRLLRSYEEKDEKTGEVKLVKVFEGPFSQKELLLKRDEIIEACMYDLGWVNADDWKAGKREEAYNN